MSNTRPPSVAVRQYCKVYIACTILFYTFLILLPAPGLPFVIIIGAHTPYYLFILFLFMADSSVISAGMHILGAFITVEALFAVAFIVTSVMALKYGRALPLIILTGIGNVISIVVFVLALCTGGSPSIAATSLLMCSIIANTAYSWRFWHHYRATQIQNPN